MPDTFSTAIRDDTAANAIEEQSVFTGSSVTDLAWPFSNDMVGVKLSVTVNTFPFAASLSSTLQMKVCSGNFTVLPPLLIAVVMRLLQLHCALGMPVLPYVTAANDL